MGYAAAANARRDGIVFGSVGAGKGATVGKILGPACAVKSGIGGATYFFNDVFVTAIVAVNALGDVYDRRSGKIIAGARTPDGKFVNAVERLTCGDFSAQARTNTTIGCVMTNAKLDKLHVNKLAAIAHDGFAMSIRPVHTDADGDTMFALSKGDKTADFNILSALTAEVTAQAIENAVVRR